MAKATTAIVRAKELYENRDHRAKELKSQGRKIIGYVCAFVPLEFITAADLIPYRITANANEPITEADTCLETVQCAYSRSLLDLGLTGETINVSGGWYPR